MSRKSKKKEEKKENGAFDVLQKCEESGKIAAFYGFVPIRGPVMSQSVLDKAKKFDPLWSPAEKIAFLLEYDKSRGGISREQGLFWAKRPFAGSKERTKQNYIECELAILGSNRSVSEGLLFQAARSILENAGYKNITLRVNSVGNRDSVAEYERRIGAYIRKKMNNFPSDFRQEVKKDPFYIIKNKEEKYKEFADEAPRFMDYLNEQSRTHFKEVLELLETLQIPYSIDQSLVGDIDYATETVFEVAESAEEGAKVLARGMRWNRLSKKLDFKKEIPAASVTIKAGISKPQKLVPIKHGNSKFYLVQFGPEAKQKSFLVLEELRKAGASVMHSLAKDKLMSQMSAVEQLNVPYVILIGQKEALEGNVLVRNSATRAQSVVPIGELSSYVRKIK